MSKSPRLPKPVTFLLRILISRPDYDFFAGDMAEAYAKACLAKGKLFGFFWLSKQMLRTVPPILLDNLKWSLIMLHNQLKTALRHFIRHKSSTLINIAGLTAAMTCCLFLYFYVGFEQSFDRHHRGYQRIYRIALNMKTESGDQITAHSSPIVAPMLRDSFPQVEYAVRLLEQPSRSVSCGNKKFYESHILYAEPDVFQVFTLPFLNGDPENALKRPGTVVIAQSVAERFFDEGQSLGQILTVNEMDYEVTGIIEDSPLNSHLRFGILLSFKEIESDENQMHFHNTNFKTYIKLAEGENPEVFESEIRRIVHQKYDDLLKPRNTQFLHFLQPLKDIHLHSYLQGESGSPGNSFYLNIFKLVGILVLLVAGINFINLRTARSAIRALEVGMRKVVGARRSQITRQFIAEAVLLTSLAAVASLLAAGVLLKPFNTLVESSFTFANLLNSGLLVFLLVVGLLMGITAGIYPAFVLSGHRPASVLKGDMLRSSRKVRLRRILVVSQFAVSIALIIATLVIFCQVNYMKDQPLGFNQAQKLVLRFPRGPHLQEKHLIYKQEFLTHPDITGATFSSTVPTRGMFLFWVWPTGKEKTEARGMANLGMDYDFISEYKLEVIAGRTFSRDRGEDSPGQGFLLNQAAVKAFGWKSPQDALTKSLRNGLPVIGVVKNFHYQGMRTAVPPLALWINPTYFGYLTLTVNSANLPQTLAFVKQTFDGFFPGEVLQYFFLDEELNRLYNSEERLARLLSVFSILGIIISCLGLMGLSAFMAERKTKEIGIRKVLGASTWSVLVHLSKTFMLWVLLANLIAWPVAYLWVKRWLQDFAYRIPFPFWLFPAATAAAIVIALLTVSFQSLRVALANPVDALRYE